MHIHSYSQAMLHISEIHTIFFPSAQLNVMWVTVPQVCNNILLTFFCAQAKFKRISAAPFCAARPAIFADYRLPTQIKGCSQTIGRFSRILRSAFCARDSPVGTADSSLPSQARNQTSFGLCPLPAIDGFPLAIHPLILSIPKSVHSTKYAFCFWRFAIVSRVFGAFKQINRLAICLVPICAEGSATQPNFGPRPSRPALLWSLRPALFYNQLRPPPLLAILILSKLVH